MERNPNKPRFWLDEDRTTVESAVKSGRDTNHITEVTVGEQAEILCTDQKTREELLASLHGRQPRD